MLCPLWSAIKHVLSGQSNGGNGEIGLESWPIPRIANDGNSEGHLRFQPSRLESEELLNTGPATASVCRSSGAVHTGISFTQAGSNPTIAPAGIVSTDQFIVAQTPLRPRVLGLSCSYKF